MTRFTVIKIRFSVAHIVRLLLLRLELDYGNATLTSIANHLLYRFSPMPRRQMICSTWCSSHIVSASAKLAERRNLLQVGCPGVPQFISDWLNWRAAIKWSFCTSSLRKWRSLAWVYFCSTKNFNLIYSWHQSERSTLITLYVYTSFNIDYIFSASIIIKTAHCWIRLNALTLTHVWCSLLIYY